MKSYVLATALFVLVAVPAAAETHTGTAEITLTTISGLTQTGQPDPSATPACLQKYHIFLGTEVVTHYQIDTSTGIEFAVSIVQVDPQPIPLHPLGIANTYAFMSDGVPPELESLGIISVRFNSNSELIEFKSTLLGKLDDTNICSISGSKTS